MEKKEYKGKFKPKFTTDPNHCKCCKKYYKSLLKHLGQQPICKLDYSDEEFDDLKAQMTSISDSNKKTRNKEYYETNRDSLLEKRAIYSEKNAKMLHKQRQSRETQLQHKEYYERNKDMLARKRDFKLLVTVNQKDHDQAENQANELNDAELKPSFYSCKLCHRIFKVQGYLLDHIRKNHPEFPKSEVEELERTILEGTKSRKEYYMENREEILKKTKARRLEEKELLKSGMSYKDIANHFYNKNRNK